MKSFFIFFIALVLIAAQTGAAKEAADKEAPAKEAAPGSVEKTSGIRDMFGLKFLWSFFWESKKNMSNRFEGIIFGPFDISLRAQVLDKRPAPPWNDWDAGKTDPGIALYHKSTGSRAVFGKLETWGLLARTRNVLAHGAPWFESHKASNADLKTAVSPTSPNELYLNAGAPSVELSRIFKKLPFSLEASANISSFFNKENSFFLQGGANFNAASRHKIHFEWLVSQKTLPERPQKSWFSEKPYLPNRDMNFYAFNLNCAHEFLGFSIGFAADYAHSEIFAFGEGDYLNGGIRVGRRPWRLSLALDGASRLYSGENGVVSGRGFRGAGKLEWFGKRGMKVLLETKLRSDGADKPFNRSDFKMNYNFPLIRGFLLRPARFSFECARDASINEDIKDKFSAMLALKIGPFSPALRGAIIKNARLDIGDAIIPYPIYSKESKIEEYRVGGEISAPIKFVTLKGSVLCRLREEEDTRWDMSVSAAARWKWGRLSIKLFNNEKDDSISYTISWRFEKKF